MSAEERCYLESAGKCKDAAESQMFGKPCFKTGGKAFTAFFENGMVFKLGGTDHSEALALKGAKLFDPSGKGRAMKEWVQVPFAHKKKWAELAQKAMEYVKSQQK